MDAGQHRHSNRAFAIAPSNCSIERTSSGKPAADAHVERWAS